METLSDIAVFVRTVDLGSFTAAANDLELSKAAVSKYVGRLEKRLGARLLNRTTRRLSLTEAGSALYQGARNALQDIETAQSDVLQLAGKPRGLLRVTLPELLGTGNLAPRIGAFRRAYRISYWTLISRIGSLASSPSVTTWPFAVHPNLSLSVFVHTGNSVACLDFLARCSGLRLRE